MQETLTFVLAGGRGSRLGGLTERRAKPAVPIGGKYRIIDFALSNCLNSRLPYVGVLTQYMAHSLVPYLDLWSGTTLRHGQSVRPLRSRNDSAYGGTADAVHQNRDVIRSLSPSHVLVLAADHVYRMDYAAMLADHRANGAQVTVGCVEVPVAEASGFGVLEVDAQDRITAFVEKPRHPRPIPGRSDTCLASMGIYIFDTYYLLKALADDEQLPNSSHDFGRDVIPRSVEYVQVQAHRLRDLARPEQPGYWRDVGTLDAYWRTNLEIAGHDPAIDLDDAAWPIVPTASSLLAGLRGAASTRACRTVAAHERSVVFPGVQIARGSEIAQSVILPGAQIGKGCVVRRAIIEEGCRLPDGMRIGVDPELDRARFEVSPQGVVLVSQQQLALAA